MAQKFGFAHLDTGLLYRAVGRRMLAGLRPESAAKSLTAEDLADEANLRGPEVAQAASQVAAIPAVRHALVDFQRVFAARAGGSVLDGRDIGTVICPSADVKLFVTASPEIRARRRTEELMHRGLKADYDTVLVDVLARDARDADRTIAPMIAADDAELLDTSQLSIAQAINRATEIVRAAQR